MCAERDDDTRPVQSFTQIGSVRQRTASKAITCVLQPLSTNGIRRHSAVRSTPSMGKHTSSMRILRSEKKSDFHGPSEQANNERK